MSYSIKSENAPTFHPCDDVSIKGTDRLGWVMAVNNADGTALVHDHDGNGGTWHNFSDLVKVHEASTTERNRMVQYAAPGAMW